MHWMDISRFADTHGYTVDRYRDASPYRDWMCPAFNQNLPYDQFISRQFAGVPIAQSNQRTGDSDGIQSDSSQNMEGGIVEEEFRIEYVVDRTSTMGQAFNLVLRMLSSHQMPQRVKPRDF
jgi:hypothetical protein